jgi:hypothetical protein
MTALYCVNLLTSTGLEAAMSEQPEALRLAEWFERGHGGVSWKPPPKCAVCTA